jgi:hypothetical protein
MRQWEIGDEVEGLWTNGHWYDATVFGLLPDGKIVVNWFDGDTNHRELHVDQVRSRVEFWARCDECEQWRSLLSAHEETSAFCCSDKYEILGCSEPPDVFYAFEKRKLKHEFIALKEAGRCVLSPLQTAFEYLLDRLPKTGSFENKTKNMLLENIDQASLLDIRTRLLSVQHELLPKFHQEDWADCWKIYFDQDKPSSQIDQAFEDVSHLGWLLEEHINWEEVARQRKTKRKAKGKQLPRTTKAARQSSRSKDSTAAVETESEVEMSASAQGISHRTAGQLQHLPFPLSRLYDTVCAYTAGLRRV